MWAGRQREYSAFRATPCSLSPTDLGPETCPASISLRRHTCQLSSLLSTSTSLDRNRMAALPTSRKPQTWIHSGHRSGYPGYSVAYKGSIVNIPPANLVKDGGVLADAEGRRRLLLHDTVPCCCRTRRPTEPRECACECARAVATNLSIWGHMHTLMFWLGVTSPALTAVNGNVDRFLQGSSFMFASETQQHHFRLL